MDLRGQDGEKRREELGYAMAALLVGLAVMSVLLAVAMPAWTTAARREKEAELIFRGEQYARAIMLFQRRVANAAPPNIDMLVEQRFLRKKYRDPITNDDFALIVVGQTPPSGAGGSDNGRGGSGAPNGSTGRGGVNPAQQSGFQTVSAQIGTPQGGGILGVTSKSREESLRLYNGRNHYNEWVFTPTQQTQTPGAAQPGVVPGVGGQPGVGPPGGGFGQPGGQGGGRGRGDGGRGRGPSGPPAIRPGSLPQTPFQPPPG